MAFKQPVKHNVSTDRQGRLSSWPANADHAKCLNRWARSFEKASHAKHFKIVLTAGHAKY